VLSTSGGLPGLVSIIWRERAWDRYCGRWLERGGRAPKLHGDQDPGLTGQTVGIMDMHLGGKVVDRG
jgi:hypothetical protein